MEPEAPAATQTQTTFAAAPEATKTEENTAFKRPVAEIDIPADPLQRDRERERRLTLANVQRARGQMGEARRTLEEALALSEGQPGPVVAPTYELLGDMYFAEERWEEARDAFAQAHVLDEKRIGAERKLAQTVLRIADAKAERSLMDAVMSGKAPVRINDPLARKSPVVAFLLSGVAPGVGQIYNDQRKKGLIFLALFVGVIAILFLTTDTKSLIEETARLFSGGKRIRGAPPIDNPLPWALMATAFGIWLYSVIDASTTAAKTTAYHDPRGAIDKTGWEV